MPPRSRCSAWGGGFPRGVVSRFPRRFVGAGAWVARNVPKAKLLELPIAAGHLGAVEFLPNHHRDPFDRLLVAQAEIEKLTLITCDELIAPYAVATLW